MYDCIIYQGNMMELDCNKIKLYSLGASVVLHLSKSIQQEGHKLYYDNYFSSFELLKTLHCRKIYAAGTIRVNRFAHPPLRSDKKMRGCSDEVTSLDGEVVLVKWLDSRAVILASNFLGTATFDEVERWGKKEKIYIKIKRPEIVKL